MKHPQYQLLVFDWDGTLIDSIEQIILSLQTASQAVCGQSVSRESARSVIGLGLSEAIEKLHPGIEKDGIDKIAARYKAHYLHENPVKPALFDGVIDMLDELVARGFTMAIATGKSRAGLDRSLEEHKLSHYFAATRCAGEYPSKPNPDMLEHIVNELDVPHTRTLMIGDSEHDLMMANNACIDAIAITESVQHSEILMKHQPLACLEKITDLSNFLFHN